jgi:DNA recombination protein RmuC
MDLSFIIAAFGVLLTLITGIAAYLFALSKSKSSLDALTLDKAKLESELTNTQNKVSELAALRDEIKTAYDQQLVTEKSIIEEKHQIEQALERSQAQLDAERTASHQSQQREQAKQEELKTSVEEAQSLREKLADNVALASKWQTKSEELGHQLETIKSSLNDRNSELKQSQQALGQLQTEYTELKTSLDERDNKHKEQLELLEQNRAQLAKDFENLANKIFEEKGKSFTETSKQSLDAMLTPFKEQMSEFKSRVEAIHTEDTKAKASLSQELDNLRKLNQRITDEAQNLTKALKGDNKQQGSWGELQAEMILESSGLSKGQEFEREANFKDEEGKNKRPDLIVKLPGGKSVIIDSKVSLVSYVGSVEAENELDKQQLLDAHVASIRTHIDGLSGKDYTNLIGMNSPDFVLMFMPIEPAFLAAVEHDRTLFNYGFERNVVLVTPTTLLPIVRTVANLWVMERSNEQARQIADQAADVFNQLCTMAERLNKVGNGLKTATNAYNSAVTAMAGQQGLYPKVAKFKELSVKVSKSLPEPNEAVPEIDNGKLDLIVADAEN